MTEEEFERIFEERTRELLSPEDSGGPSNDDRDGTTSAEHTVGVGEHRGLELEQAAESPSRVKSEEGWPKRRKNCTMGSRSKSRTAELSMLMPTRKDKKGGEINEDDKSARSEQVKQRRNSWGAKELQVELDKRKDKKRSKERERESPQAQDSEKKKEEEPRRSTPKEHEVLPVCGDSTNSPAQLNSRVLIFFLGFHVFHRATCNALKSSSRPIQGMGPRPRPCLKENGSARRSRMSGGGVYRCPSHRSSGSCSIGRPNAAKRTNSYEVCRQPTRTTVMIDINIYIYI